MPAIMTDCVKLFTRLNIYIKRKCCVICVVDSKQRESLYVHGTKYRVCCIHARNILDLRENDPALKELVKLDPPDKS